jgi:uncharacterized membrane protein YhaH (DUF805 family)
MKLDVYRSCSRQEKQEVLNAFWHRNVQPSSRIRRAAYQYGPYAVLCLVAVALELAFVIAVTIHRALVVGCIAIAFEGLVMLSLWWAVVRWREVKSPAA